VKPESLSLRLALMFSVAALVGFIGIGLVLREVLHRELTRQQQDQVQSRMVDMRYLLEKGRADDLAERAKLKIETLSSTGRVRYWMWSADPVWRLGAEAEELAKQADGRTRQKIVGGVPMAVAAVSLDATPVRKAMVLIVGVTSDPFDQTTSRFERYLLPIVLGGALVVAALGYWIARVGLKPVLRLSGEARRIGPTARKQRLSEAALPVELAQMGKSFNAALDRLEGAYVQLESFNADVAHELRTPLANLIGQTQVALSRERSAPELRELLHTNLEELERLRAIVADMLFLARAEQGERAAQAVPRSLAAELIKTVDFYEVLLDEAGLSVQIEGDAQAVIEPALIHRAMSNLLQNAIQHAPSGSTLRARVQAVEGLAEISVSNELAQVIPADQLARLFDRFYRGDASRANSENNHGLGLAIVKAVALMHGGSVFARCEQGQITVGFTVPTIG
jgi:two-component system heavy metal sensor histidine kinase CusS